MNTGAYTVDDALRRSTPPSPLPLLMRARVEMEQLGRGARVPVSMAPSIGVWDRRRHWYWRRDRQRRRRLARRNAQPEHRVHFALRSGERKGVGCARRAATRRPERHACEQAKSNKTHEGRCPRECASEGGKNDHVPVDKAGPSDGCIDRRGMGGTGLSSTREAGRGPLLDERQPGRWRLRDRRPAWDRRALDMRTAEMRVDRLVPTEAELAVLVEEEACTSPPPPPPPLPFALVSPPARTRSWSVS